MSLSILLIFSSIFPCVVKLDRNNLLVCIFFLLIHIYQKIFEILIHGFVYFSNFKFIRWKVMTMEVEESCFLISSLLSKTTYDIKSLFELTVQSTGHHYGEVEAAAASRQLAHHICNQEEIIANRCIHAPLLHRHSPGSQPASDTTQCWQDFPSQLSEPGQTPAGLLRGQCHWWV